MMLSERKIIVLLLLLVLIFMVYSNAVDTAWHMDDFPNITQNSRLHLKRLGADEIAATFFAKPAQGKSNQLYRPVACLTFALNWYFGQQDVRGYHIVNISLHVITAFLLYLSVLTVFKTPNLKNRFPDNQQFIALLTAALWAVNPVQTQTVDYIVQRMTILATLFCLLSIYFYIKARLSDSPAFRGMVFAACIISYLLAMGSKENAAILPLGLLLVEAVFFQDPGWSRSTKRIFWCAVASGIFVFLTAVLFFLQGDLFSFMNGYAARPFSLEQRLLTEPRILIFYLSQLFFPLASRLSIQHDVVISTSMVTPWTTLPAIGLICFLIVWGVLNIRKRPLAAFGVLFFFLNHLIESTVLPLELLFEHRNYLPSLFIFLPVAAGAKRLLDYLVNYHYGIFRLSVCCLVLVLMGLGLNTYARNRAWATQKSLWEDAMVKAPESARPYQNVADSHMKSGNTDLALVLYDRSLSLYDPKPKQSRASSLNNSGNIYARMGQHGRAIGFYEKALGVYPGHEKTLHNLVAALVQLGKWSQASEYADVLLSKYSYAPYLNLKGFILLKQNMATAAIPYFIRALKISPDSRNAAVNLAVAFSRTDRFEAADRILKRMHKRFPADTTILLCRVENSLRAGEKSKAARSIDRLFSVCQVAKLKTLLARQPDADRQVPYATAWLAPAIAASLRARSEGLTQHDGIDERLND
jgi:tetratricopeptide (TPR) repeat protein